MASHAWSKDDLHVLEQHVNDEDWFDAISDLFPQRSYNSISVCMSRLRTKLGVKCRRGARIKDDQDADNAKAVIATGKLLEATLRVGRWS